MQPNSPIESEPRLSPFNSINNRVLTESGEDVVKAIEGKQMIDGND